MGTWSRSVRAIATLMLVALAACSDGSPLAVESPTPQLKAFFDNAPAPGFDAIRRLEPLAQDQVVQKMIFWMGGELEAGGISIRVPMGALWRPTVITMRVLEGDALAVEFEPHGLQFFLPVEVRYDVEGTTAEDYFANYDDDDDDGLSMSDFMGVYYEQNAGGGNDAVETFQLDYDDGEIVLETNHFSGYVAASG